MLQEENTILEEHTGSQQLMLKTRWLLIKWNGPSNKKLLSPIKTHYVDDNLQIPCNTAWRKNISARYHFKLPSWYIRYRSSLHSGPPQLTTIESTMILVALLLETKVISLKCFALRARKETIETVFVILLLLNTTQPVQNHAETPDK